MKKGKRANSNKASRTKQLQFDKPGFKKEKSDHGGSLPNPQKRKRPLGFRSTTHLVLRSTKAVKKWSFRRKHNFIEDTLYKFAKKHHIHVLSHANVGNHLHLHLRISSRKNYKAFIRALSSAIALGITGYNRWNKAPEGFKFWDQRPFSRIVSTWNEFMNLKKYVELNRWEGLGADRDVAHEFMKLGWIAPSHGFG